MSKTSATPASSTKYPIRPTTRSPESFDSIRRRNMAAEILQSYEKLSWLSFQRCETIAQTRIHVQRMVAGIDDDSVRWPEDFTPHPKKAGEGSSRKGKERASLGSGGAEGSNQSKRKERKSLGASEDSGNGPPRKQRGDGNDE